MNDSVLFHLSVLIVTWNGDVLLRNCLESIKTVYGAMPEIVVVDNANLSSTKELVGTFENVKYIATQKNLGFAGGNNVGIPLCTKKYVLLLNNDTILHDDAFTPLIAYLAENPSVAVVQGKMCMPLQDNTLDACGYMIDRFGGVYGRFNFRPAGSVATPTGPIYAAKGACLMFRRSVLSEIAGPLFHDFFLNNGEETDFCYRVWLTGNEVHFVDGPCIDHLCGQSISRFKSTENGSRTLSNLLFSYLTTFDTYGLAKVIPGFVFHQFCMAIIHLLKGHLQDAVAIFSAFSRTLQQRMKIRQVRREIQSTRRVSDREIFEKVYVRPSFLYQWLGMRGLLIDYIKKNASALPEVF